MEIKKNMRIRFIFFITSMLGLCSCIPVIDHVDSIQVVNFSEEGQIICYTCSDSIGSKIDSLTMNPYLKQFDHFKSKIMDEDVHVDKNSFTRIKIPFKKKYITRCCEDGLIRFFFMSDSVFLNNPWDTIVRYQMYSSKLLFSKEDLENVNWIIEYK